jgi:3-mercaptopyruvate sulfurtransferase SseA
MRRVTSGSRMWGSRGAVAALAALGLALAGCTGSEDTSSTQVQVNTPLQIAQESADDYNDNVNGLITGKTLSRWLSDWENERPAGVTGRLIILQQGTGPEGYEYVKTDAPNVHTYAMSSSEISMDRSNGVIVTRTIVADGPTMDAFFKKYGLDPNKDMIVCARGSGSILNQARCWYTLRYWGVPKRNVAFLDGDFGWQVNKDNPNAMEGSDFAASAATPPMDGKVSVRDLPEDNFALIATIEDMFAVATTSAQNDTTDGVLVWDARGMNQYSAGEQLEMGQSGCADPYCAPPELFNYMTTFQNGGSRQGHPHGTLQLQFTRMTVATEGSRFKSKAELAAYMNGELDADGLGFVDYTYQPVGVGKAYQPGDTVYVYCETTQRAQVTGFVTAAILGIPTRYYEGAMVEWNSLSNIVASDGLPILPADSPWRADLDTLSFFVPSNDPSAVAEREIVDAYAPRSNAYINEDRIYKYGLGSSGGSSGGGDGGVAPPANPCGG